jgi:hypothetical protein
LEVIQLCADVLWGRHNFRAVLLAVSRLAAWGHFIERPVACLIADWRGDRGTPPRLTLRLWYGHHPRVYVGDDGETIISSACKQAVKWRPLAQNPAVFVDLPRMHRREGQVLSPEEARRFCGFRPIVIAKIGPS